MATTPSEKRSVQATHLQAVPDPEVARPLPAARAAEKSILSSMLQEPGEYIGAAIEAHITPKHFNVPAHQMLYELLLELDEKGTPVELVTLVQLLRDRGLLENIGGPAELTSIYTHSPTAAHFHHHLGMVRSKHILRSVITKCTESIDSAFDNPEDVGEFLDSVESEIYTIKEQSEVQGEVKVRDLIGGVVEILEQFMAGERGMEGTPTKYPKLDDMSKGLKPGEMFIIAARPSMGKTSFMMNIVEHVAIDQGVPTFVFSCEMSSQQIVQRLLFSRARYGLGNLKPGLQPTKDELSRIMNASRDLTKAPLFIDDTPAITIGDLRAKARRKKRDENIGLIAVDYLQLMRSTSRQAEGSREREIAEISSGLKAIAKELGIPVIVLAQLNRGPEARGGAPRMSDLRESGSIEQDADLIGLLYREEYYNDTTDSSDEAEQERESNLGKAELILAKNRNGPTGNVELTFLKELMRFETRAPDPHG